MEAGVILTMIRMPTLNHGNLEVLHLAFDPSIIKQVSCVFPQFSSFKICVEFGSSHICVFSFSCFPPPRGEK